MKKNSSVSLKQLLAACGCLLIFIGITLFLFGYRRDEKLFSRISSHLFVQEMTSSTLNMHYTLAYPMNFGIYDYEAVLPTYSADEHLAGQASTENLLSALNSLDESKLSDKNAYACKLLKRSLVNSLNMSSYSYYEEPLAPSSGMQSQLPILLAEYTFRNKQDVKDYLKLLEQTDEYFASLLCYEQEKAKAGLLMPASSLKKVKEQCDTIVSKEELAAGTHFLQTTFHERLQYLLDIGEITENDITTLTAQNDRLLNTVLQPAYEALADGLFVLEDSSIPLTGLGAKPQGKEYYQSLLIAETGSYRSITEIQKLLTDKFHEEYQAIRTLATEHPEVMTYLSSSDTIPFPYQEADAMLLDLQKRMQESFPAFPFYSGTKATSAEPAINHALPSVTVKNVSSSLEPYCAPAFYLTAPIDDTTNNVIYINQKNSPSGLELYTTLAHEGYPGHLYQTVYHNQSFMQNGENKVRQLLWYGGYLEGWALYVEFQSFDYASALMKEQGSEKDALCIQLEKHNRSLQLCLYSLLDIMIHYENASYNQIANFLDGLGVTSTAACKAVYTYIAEEPCNYLKYYLGYLEILELQKVAKQEWGTNYSDYNFHTFYLECGPSDFTSLNERLHSFSQSFGKTD